MPFEKGHRFYGHRKVKDDKLQSWFSVSDPDYIQKLADEIKQISWEYVKGDLKPDMTPEQIKFENKRIERRNLLQLRDRALASLIVLIGPRISECLSFQRGMFTVLEDRISMGEFKPGKHGKMRRGLFLPLKGAQAPLTRIFMDWLMHVPDDAESYLFPTARPFGNIRWNAHMGRGRAHQILKQTVNLFPHLLRGLSETWHGKVTFKKDPYKLAGFMGIVSLNSLLPYVGEPFESDLEAANQELKSTEKKQTSSLST